MSVLVIDLKSSAARWPALPAPDDPYVSLPGCARASAINSCTVFTGTDIFTTSTLLCDVAQVIAVRSRSRIVVEPLVEIGVNCKAAERGYGLGVAIRRRVGRNFGGQAAGGAGAVVDHDLVTEHRGEFRRNCARDDIKPAAG